MVDYPLCFFDKWPPRYDPNLVAALFQIQGHRKDRGSPIDFLKDTGTLKLFQVRCSNVSNVFQNESK